MIRGRGVEGRKREGVRPGSSSRLALGGIGKDVTRARIGIC